MGFLQPISREEGHREGLSLTVDKSDRICLSAGLKRSLGYEGKTELYLFWDEEYHRIGISKKHKDPNVVTFPFDNRGYCTKNVREFVRRCQINNENSVKFHYEGMEGDIYVFGQSGRRITSLRMQKNGNLERA